MVAATVLALVGLVQMVVGQWSAGSGPSGPEAQVGGVKATVTGAEWVKMEMDDTGQYQMPSSMMPGMPAAGQERLAIPLTLANEADGVRMLDPASEFVLREVHGGRSWEPEGNTFEGFSRLTSGDAVNGTLFFDLPPIEGGGQKLQLDWRHGNDEAHLTLPLEGSPPAHTH